MRAEMKRMLSARKVGRGMGWIGTVEVCAATRWER